jgi:Protein of unknown function (DUF3300)
MKRQLRLAPLRGLTALFPALLVMSAPAFAQFHATPLPAGMYSLLKDVATLPEPLLTNVLKAATYWEQIPAAAKFADANRTLHGDALANAYAKVNLKLDPSVASLIAVPDVLDKMANNMIWTARLGSTVLMRHDDVINAVQVIRSISQREAR